ncbi:MAG: ABC transporter ATP-binding protein [Anaerolineae bacterium]
MRTDPVIAVDGLSRHFGEVVAVDHLDLQVYPGEVFGFLGHNGAGKTTTVRLLNGVLAPDSGTARVLELDPLDDGPALRRRTGVLTETPSLDERLTGRENLEIYAELYDVPRSQVRGRVAFLLEAFELDHRADDKVGGYSRGMKQRLALARALLHEPEILFLDEPTAGLDPVATRHVHDMITRLSHQEQRTVFLCTHNLTEAQKLCARVAVLEHGRLVALGTPSELARKLGRSQRLEIEVAPEGVSTTLDVLQRTAGMADPTAENGTISVVGAEREAIPDLVAALVEAGVRVYRITPQEPSLEDVYFALHDEGEVGP